MNESFIYIQETIILMSFYSFDLGNYTVKELIIKWSKKYAHSWLPLAVIEAIYQGRLKAISVEHILNLWGRSSQPTYHFTVEFKQLICDDIFLELEDINDNDLDPELAEVIEAQKRFQGKKIEECSGNSEDNNQENNPIRGILIEQPKSSISQFQPLDDYSTCYLKLKQLLDS